MEQARRFFSVPKGFDGIEIAFIEEKKLKPAHLRFSVVGFSRSQPERRKELGTITASVFELDRWINVPGILKLFSIAGKIAKMKPKELEKFLASTQVQAFFTELKNLVPEATFAIKLRLPASQQVYDWDSKQQKPIIDFLNAESDTLYAFPIIDSLFLQGSFRPAGFWGHFFSKEVFLELGVDRSMLTGKSRGRLAPLLIQERNHGSEQ